MVTKQENTFLDTPKEYGLTAGYFSWCSFLAWTSPATCNSHVAMVAKFISKICHHGNGCHASFLDCNVVIGRLWIPQNNKYKVVYLLSRKSAALLVVKNKSISPLWELNYFHVNSSKKNSNVLTPSMHGCLVIWTVAKTNNKIVCYFIW